MRRYFIPFCKKFFVSTFLLLLVGFFLEASTFSPYPKLIGPNGKVHPSLVEIAKVLFPEEAPGESASVELWNTFLQKKFLRPNTHDHQEAQKAGHHPEHVKLLPHFQILGLINEIMPEQNEFDVIVIFGGTPWDTEERFLWTERLVTQRGITTKGFMYINGRRELKSSELDWLKHKKSEGIAYQHEAAQLLWENSNLKKYPLIILTLDPPPGRRANTDDTLHAFLKYAQDHGIHRALFITNGSYGPYQFETASRVLQNNLQFEGSSSGSKSDVSTVSLTDTLARRFYTIVQSIKQQ
jgi:hypothetical protein